MNCVGSICTDDHIHRLQQIDSSKISPINLKTLLHQQVTWCIQYVMMDDDFFQYAVSVIKSIFSSSNTFFCMDLYYRRKFVEICAKSNYSHMLPA